jgi:hypothetical protein
MAEDLYNFGDDPAEPQQKDSLFLWTILILLLIGAAFACWLGSFYVFGHPEEARSYAILKKLKKIENPRRFDVTAAPQGEFLTAQKVFERYSTLTRLELQEENAELLRIYIKNYTETKKLVPYLRGNFTVMEVNELTKNDLLPTGTVALMQASDYSQVVVEHLFPASGPNIDATKRLLIPGGDFPIYKTNDVVAIIHIERLADGRMLLTVVPLHYPTYGLKGGAGTFATEPPVEVNVAAGAPVTKGDRMNESLKRFAQLRANEAPREEPAKAPSGSEVVRIDTVPMGTTAPESGALPEPPVARAQPVQPLGPTPRPRPLGDLALNQRPQTSVPIATPLVSTAPPPIAAPLPGDPLVTQRPVPAPETTLPPAMTVPGATATPPPVALTTPAPAAPGVSPGGVPLKPFVQSTRGIVPPSEQGGQWRVYSAGAQPRGRTITPTEALNLVGQVSGGERIYLVGTFAVTAKGDNKAVFRPRGEPLPPGSAMRIIAEFPNGAIPPGENEVFSRDVNRAFEVRSVSRADDGVTINVEVREVTRDQQ